MERELHGNDADEDLDWSFDTVAPIKAKHSLREGKSTSLAAISHVLDLTLE